MVNDSLTVAVIGAYGFIGKATVADLLKQTDYNIIALSRRTQSGIFPASNRLIEKVIDYSDKNAVNSILSETDVVVNLAGKMGDYGSTYEMMYEDNVTFVDYITCLCKEAGIRQFIHVSTPGVQGLGLRLALESDPCKPQDDYQKTKMLGEKAVIDSCADSSMKYTILRPDFVYGVGDERRLRLYRNIKKHRFALTTNGKALISPTYVSDVAQGITKSINNSSAYNEIFNISGDEVSVKKYLDTVADCLNTRIIWLNIGRPLSVFLAKIVMMLSNLLHIKPIVTESQINFLSLDHSTSHEKAAAIGYSPEISLAEGIRLTIDDAKI